MVTTQRDRVGAVTEPAQHEHGLAETGQRPGALAGAAAAALGGWQPTHLPGEFTGNAEHVTIGNHVESFSRPRSA